MLPHGCEPIRIVKAVVYLAEQGEKFSSLLASVRAIEESDEQTLQRLIRERQHVVRILQEHPKTRDWHEDLDFGYYRNFTSAVDKLMRK